MVTRQRWLNVRGADTMLTRARVGKGYAVMLIRHNGHRSAMLSVGEYHGVPPHYPDTRADRSKLYANGRDASGGIVRTIYPG